MLDQFGWMNEKFNLLPEGIQITNNEEKDN